MDPIPAGAARTWARQLLDTLDRFAFRELDLVAVAHGWTVGRPALLVHEYRDPRWSTVAACVRCGFRVHVGDDCAHCGLVGVRAPAPLRAGLP